MSGAAGVGWSGGLRPGLPGRVSAGVEATSAARGGEGGRRKGRLKTGWVAWRSGSACFA
ncbi:MAG: hypothetical protein HYX73_00835 [Acidobacteria bacterium]|nr:hypothetical protein [Acidobacteriota bacterium]